MISIHKIYRNDAKNIFLCCILPVQNKAIISILTLLFVSIHGVVLAAKQPDCAFLPAQKAVVSHVTNEKIIVLEDGRELKLANIKFLTADIPPLLSNLKNQQITFYSSGRLKDRYGRLLVQIVTQDNGREKWLQAQLIESGNALANATAQNSGCSLELLKLEQTARENNRGEWSKGNSFQIFKAENIKGMNNKQQGDFVLVTGKVKDIGFSARNGFINFGSDRRKDFTIVIAQRLLKRKKQPSPKPWPKLKSLIGKTVRVRGFIDHYQGPMIRLTVPTMLEVLDP